MAVLEQMQVWVDPVKRPGPEAMAVDEWLLETADAPVLRIYQWLGEWGSVGYFGKIEAARSAFPELEWVRRWTGGGTVDHRADWTYTMIAPAESGIAGLRGADSYRMIHEALAGALRLEIIDARLSTGSDLTGASLCFENPVGHDLIDPSGRKLAGAGQRRTRRGLLHQGSVAAPCDVEISHNRSGHLADLLANEWRYFDLQPPDDLIASKIQSRYGNPSWNNRC
jgi:lipoyl(octanoyl) transferase